MSLQRNALNFSLKTFVKPVLNATPFSPSLLAIGRPQLDRLGALFLRPPSSIVIKPTMVSGIEAEWVSGEPYILHDRVLLYLHGGGYIACSPRTHRSITGRLALIGRMKVLAINYRKAPENPFPAPLEDAIKAYEFLLAKGYKPQNILIAGDSAGGHLTLSLLIALRDRMMPTPGGGICFSPWTDLSVSGESIQRNHHHDPMIPGARIKEAARMVLGDLHPEDPLASPLFAELHDLPPLLIHVGDTEVLFDDSHRFAERALQYGVDVEFKAWQDMCHVFQLFAQYVPQSHKAMLEVGRFMETRFRSAIPSKRASVTSIHQLRDTGAQH